MKSFAHPACLPDDLLLRECKLSRVRRSGPGGQRRNKVETGVVVLHKPSSVRAESNESRSPETNKKNAIFRLRIQLALSVRAEFDECQPPSDLWKSRCRGEKISVNPSHCDFPALLAEAFNAVMYFRGDVKSASTWLNCTSSQLVKFLKLESHAWSSLNVLRKEEGLSCLK